MTEEQTKPAPTKERMTLVQGAAVTLFTMAIAWCTSSATKFFQESDNAAIHDADNRELRAALTRCRDREADRTDAWLRNLYNGQRGIRE